MPLPASTVLTRPFHWGIVVMNDPKLAGQLPDVEPGRMVTASKFGVIVTVRHAQDIEADSFDGDFEWAEVTVTSRLLAEVPADSGWRPVYSGRLLTPSGQLYLGDADEDVRVPAHPGRSTVTVSVPAELPEEDLTPDAIRIDLLPDTRRKWWS